MLRKLHSNVIHSGALNLPVKADIEFVFPRPKSHYGSGKNADVLKPSAPKHCVSRGNGDIDKLSRSTLDGLSVSAGEVYWKMILLLLNLIQRKDI